MYKYAKSTINLSFDQHCYGFMQKVVGLHKTFTMLFQDIKFKQITLLKNQNYIIKNTMCILYTHMIILMCWLHAHYYY